MQIEKYTRTETPNGVFGIYMDTDIIHVRILTGGKSQPVLSMPAYFNLDDLDDVLTGRRAVVQANMNPKKALHSVLAFMQEAESAVSSTLEPCSIRYCIALNTVQKHRPNGRCLNTGFIKNGSSYTTHKYAKYPA